MRTIYIYEIRETNLLRKQLGKFPIYKIGDTTIENVSSEEAALIRIKEQDTTSCYAPLNMIAYYEVPDSFMPDIKHVDKELHKWLEERGYYKYRTDANREWFSFENEEIPQKLINEFLHGVNALNNYDLRKSQQLAFNKIIKYFDQDTDTTFPLVFLLAAKMRFGKNFTWLKVVKYFKYKTVLVLTYRPAVFESLKDDIENHILFANDFNFIEYKNVRENIKLNPNKTNIVVCSAQMLGYKYNIETDSFNGDFNKIKKNLNILSNFDWDFLITDECHYGTTTENYKDICDTLNCKRTLLISGTPFKQIDNFEDDQKFIYTYLDEQKDKLSGDPAVQMMADLHQFAIKMDKNLLKKYAKYIEIVDYPTMRKLFHALNDGNFACPEVTHLFIDLLLNKYLHISETHSIINHCFALFDGVKECTAFCNYVNDRYSKEYVAINCSGNEITDVLSVKRLISQAKADGKKTISCSCGRFIEGVSIGDWNAVIMLHDGKSPERYFQSMFRGQTPMKGKNDFYVIDFNPERMLSLNHEMIMKHTDKRNGETHEQIGREWLKAAPILVYDEESDQHLSEIDYSTVERVYFNNDCIGSDKMTDNSCFNRIHQINISNSVKLRIIKLVNTKTSGQNKDTKLNSNGVDKGKNKVSRYDIEDDENKRNKNKKNSEITISEVISKIKTVCKEIPHYILLTNSKSVEDIITSMSSKTNKVLFDRIIGVSNEIFTIALDNKIINIEGFNNAISEFWEEYNYSYTFKYGINNAKLKNKFCKRWNIYD